MKNLINSIPFYFLAPLYFATLLLFLFFNIPIDPTTQEPNYAFYQGVFALLALVTLPNLVFFLKPLRMNLDSIFHHLKNQKLYYPIILGFSFLVILFGPLDIYTNGFKLTDPAYYADFYGMGRYIRHITMLCWILIPVAFIFIRNPYLKTFFILYGLLFPIVIVDRNRLLFSIYALFFSLILTMDPKNTKRTFLCTLMGLMFCAFIFVVIGYCRSGNNFAVASSGMVLLKNHYPLKALFFHLPYLVQQLVLYITTPIFNFTTIASAHILSAEVLLKQFAPFSRELFSYYPDVPILIERFNVGTEFYPFLLYGGFSLVVVAFFLFFAGFIASYQLLKACPNIFTFLIFLKLSYTAIFMGFSPQFFILYNAAFCALMLCLWGSAVVLEQRILSLLSLNAPFFRKREKGWGKLI